MFNIKGAGAYKECAWCDIRGKQLSLFMYINVLYRNLQQTIVQNGLLGRQAFPPANFISEI